MSAASLAAELADFAQFPPERNTLEGTCLADGGYVGAGAGRLVLGRDARGTFAGYLHSDCAERVRELQAERTQVPDALEVTGPNVWAGRTEPGEDGLTTFTHLSGPGIPGVISARRP